MIFQTQPAVKGCGLHGFILRHTGAEDNENVLAVLHFHTAHSTSSNWVLWCIHVREITQHHIDISMQSELDCCMFRSAFLLCYFGVCKVLNEEDCKQTFSFICTTQSPVFVTLMRSNRSNNYIHYHYIIIGSIPQDNYIIQ